MVDARTLPRAARCREGARGLLSLVVVGCSGSAADPDARVGDPQILVGTFAIELVAARPASGTDPAREAYTDVLGTVRDGPQPQAVEFVATIVEGGCQLLVPDVPFCTTPCGSDAVCVAADTCQPYATKQSVGTIHLAGLTATTGQSEIEIDPINDNYLLPGNVDLAYPPFAAGAAVAVAADGSEFTSAFRIDGTGLAELILTADAYALAADQPLVLGWNGSSGETELAVKLDISHHGGTRGKIECKVPDTGALTISAEMVGGLLDLGASGYPSIIVTRRSIASTVIGAGRVDLDITSEVERPVTVPGVESCTDDSQCTPPETCRDDLTCG